MNSSVAKFGVGAVIWLMATVAVAGFFDRNKDPLRIEPKATISLKYPNPWDINNQIALNNDGSRLIDATHGARYIRVWDWQNNKVVQQLLLNEKAPEGNDNKPHDIKLGSTPGKELALSPDGRLMAVCVPTDKGQTRVWNLKDGAIVADIPSFFRYVPNQEQEKIFGWGCDSVSFSNDGKYMAILDEVTDLYDNEADLAEVLAINKTIVESAQAEMKTGKAMPPLVMAKKPGTPITGLAIFATNTWKLERIFYRPAYQKPTFKSRPLFDASSKTISAVIFDQAPVGVWNTWVGNRIVRWDIATGAQLEERDMPQLVNGENGLWWTPLPGGREVWWRNGFHQTPGVNDERTLYQTDSAEAQCRVSPVSSPTFESDVISNCAYLWVLTILNLDTGHIKYLAPFKKNTLRVTGGTQEHFYWANISPDGAHIVSFHTTENTKNHLRASSSVEVLNSKTHQLEASYSDDVRFERDAVFSSDSRYFAFSANKSNDWASSALIFELPKNK